MPIDGTTVAVRDDDLVPLAPLRGWLATAAAAWLPAGTSIDVRQFPSGFSNLTYLLSLQGEHGRRALVLRRPPRGVTGGIAHDMVREYGILQALHPQGAPVPQPVACCADVSVIGAPFYLMTHVDGVILRGPPPAVLTDDPMSSPARVRALCRTFAATLAQLHAVDVHASALAGLGRPEGYVARQVHGWVKRWEASRTADVSAMDRVATWLAANVPPDRDAALVHNDFKFDNLVLDDELTEVRAILDWEMATIGDPLMDLGTTLAYWVEPDDDPIFRSLGLGITAVPGAFSRAQLVEAYGVESGRDVSDAPFYLTFGLFKVAVIAQQIFARWQHGLTTDPRFAGLGTVVEALAAKALSAYRM